MCLCRRAPPKPEEHARAIATEPPYCCYCWKAVGTTEYNFVWVELHTYCTLWYARKPSCRHRPAAISTIVVKRLPGANATYQEHKYFLTIRGWPRHLVSACRNIKSSHGNTSIYALILQRSWKKSIAGVSQCAYRDKSESRMELLATREWQFVLIARARCVLAGLPVSTSCLMCKNQDQEQRWLGGRRPTVDSPSHKKRALKKSTGTNTSSKVTCDTRLVFYFCWRHINIVALKLFLPPPDIREIPIPHHLPILFDSHTCRTARLRNFDGTNTQPPNCRISAVVRLEGERFPTKYSPPYQRRYRRRHHLLLLGMTFQKKKTR